MIRMCIGYDVSSGIKVLELMGSYMQSVRMTPAEGTRLFLEDLKVVANCLCRVTVSMPKMLVKWVQRLMALRWVDGVLPLLAVQCVPLGSVVQTCVAKVLMAELTQLVQQSGRPQEILRLALRQACVAGRLDVVRHLCEAHEAFQWVDDVCIRAANRKGCIAIVNYLTGKA